jgi:predicted Zn finger-like uncharacterized protein
MKITCQSCQAKYTIADEKVGGKTVKIKCKKCGASIVVHGNEGGAAAAEPLAAGVPPGAEPSEEGEAHVAGHGAGASGNPNEEWTVNVTDDDQRTMTTAQILVEYQRGVLNDDSYIWKDGMADWLPLSSVPEVMSLVAAAGPRVPPAAASDPYAAQMEGAAAQADPQFGLGGTLMMETPSGPTAGAGFASNVMSPGGGAARRAQNRGGAVDLFASAPERQLSDPALANAGPPGAGAVGARNENSVLFSLSALNAAHSVPRSPQGRGEEAVLDLRPAAPVGPARNNGRAGFDDIMNLGGGMAAAPILAPPPLLAPVVEAPPPQMAPVAAFPTPGMQGAPLLMPDMQPQKKSSAGLILGVVAGLVVLGGVGLFFAFREPSPPPSTDEATTASAAPTSAPSAVPTPTAAPTPSPAETAQATAPSGSPTTPSTFSKPGGVIPGGTRPGSKPVEKVEEKPVEKPPEKPPEKPAETPTSGGGKDFDRAAASAALSRASGAARGCKKPDGPTGSGKVRVTFAPSGNVTSATVEGPPFAGTPVGGCIASAFRGARVPPFEGAPVSVSKTVNIN